MQTMPVKDTRQEDALREAWVRDVTALARDVASWAHNAGWIVTQSDVSVSEEGIGSYTVPKLEMDVPQSFVGKSSHWEQMAGRLVLEPVASNAGNGQGRIDLYAWPSFFRVTLRRAEPDAPATWIVRTESGLDWPQAWSEHTFLGIAIGLLNA